MYGTFSFSRYSTTRSQPRISALRSPLSVAVARLCGPAQDLGSLTNAVFERREGRFKPRLRELVRKRQRHVLEGDLRALDLRFDGRDKVGDRRRRAAEAEGLGAVRRRPRRPDEGPRDVGRVVELSPPAEADPVGLAAHGRIDRERRAGGEALVAARPVDRERAQADARDAVVLPVDPRRPLVGELVDAVVRAGDDLVLLF